MLSCSGGLEKEVMGGWGGGMGAARLRGQRGVVTCWPPVSSPGIDDFCATIAVVCCLRTCSEATCKQHSSCMIVVDDIANGTQDATHSRCVSVCSMKVGSTQ